MRITDIRISEVAVNHRGNWIFIHVDTDEGISGLGEASQSLNDSLLKTAVRWYADSLRGTDPLNISKFRSSLKANRGGRLTATAVSSIEQALWDIKGQVLGAPIHALLGGKVREAVRLYANINRHITDRSPDGFAAAAKLAVEEGFTAIKIAPFDEITSPSHVRTGRNAPHRRGIDRIDAVRNAVGDAVELAVDCHARMEPSEAIEVGRLLEPYNLLWYEEPVSCGDPSGLAAVTSSVPMSTASAESLYGVEGFTPFLSERIVDVLMPDVKHCGGIAEMREISGAARVRNLLVAPHNPSGPVAMAATGHAVAGMQNFLILEYAWGEVPWRHEILDPPERIEEGHLILNDRPGIGHRFTGSGT